MNSVTTSHRPCAGLIALGALLAMFTVAAHATPLTPQQQNQALELANGASWPKDVTPGTTSVQPRQTHQLGLQTISIERDVIKHGATNRRVRVYQYHYVLESARVVTVSLAEQAVVRQSLIESVHLPLTPAEHAHALQVLSGDEHALVRLRKDQQRRGRTPFTRIDDLSVKASIFKPLQKDHPCAQERCALLSLFDASNTVFAEEPIIELKDGIVSWLVR